MQALKSQHRILSLILAVMLVIGTMSITAYAAPISHENIELEINGKTVTATLSGLSLPGTFDVNQAESSDYELEWHWGVYFSDGNWIYYLGTWHHQSPQDSQATVGLDDMANFLGFDNGRMGGPLHDGNAPVPVSMSNTSNSITWSAIFPDDRGFDMEDVIYIGTVESNGIRDFTTASYKLNGSNWTYLGDDSYYGNPLYPYVFGGSTPSTPEAPDVTQTATPSVTSPDTINLDMDGVKTAYVSISLGTSSATPTDAKADQATATVEGNAVTVDPSMLTADGNITVTAIKQGTATIHIAFTGGDVSDATYDKSITVKVNGPDTVNPTYPSSGGSGGSSGGGSNSRDGSSSSTTTSSSGPVNVTSASATTAVNSALAAAKASGADSATARLVNPGNITLATLQAMVRQAGTTPLKLQADSMNADGRTVDVRITLDPKLATNNLNLSASTTNAAAKAAETIFEKFFSNNVSVVSLGQKGSFGQPVEIAAKIDPALDTDNLVFYSYNSATNSYTRIANPSYWVDRNGYVHFTTTLGGNIIISDGALAKR